jgi:hypothetical protein
VVEAATYDDEISEFWRSLVGRFIDATQRRLIQEGADPDEAAGMAFSLVWMTERACYQHVVRGAKISDEQLVASLSQVWVRAIYS